MTLEPILHPPKAKLQYKDKGRTYSCGQGGGHEGGRGVRGGGAAAGLGVGRVGGYVARGQDTAGLLQ